MKIRPPLLVLGLACASVITACGDSKSSSAAPGAGASAEVAINDPTGYYKLFSDPSVTQHPKENVTVGDGSAISFTYDGSKSRQPAILDYQLFYVDKQGEVRPIGGGSFDAADNGVYSKVIAVYDTPANGRPGFLKLSTVSSISSNGPITGSEIQLGMYPIRLQKSAD
ncbi:MAG: hypothetical protein KDK97_07195 [Verrucomicrobiales bacterium]|nr:hypothetical protein [Verrucomicrobiales bacterium]MCP5557624.1 hypothetical protein [Verrucomicrobiaceae bacterium]